MYRGNKFYFTFLDFHGIFFKEISSYSMCLQLVEAFSLSENKCVFKNIDFLYLFQWICCKNLSLEGNSCYYMLLRLATYLCLLTFLPFMVYCFHMWWDAEYQLYIALGILILLMTCCCFSDILRNYKKWKRENDQNMKPLVKPITEEVQGRNKQRLFYILKGIK